MRKLLLWLGRWLVARYEPAKVIVLPVVTAEIRQAVYESAADVGLHRESLNDSTDLTRTGKLYEVLYTAAHRLHRDCELRTVEDVMTWLAEAPAKD